MPAIRYCRFSFVVLLHIAVTTVSPVDSSGIDSCPGCGRPHTAHPVAKISKVKDLALILLITAFNVSSFHLLPKKRSLSNHFATL